jgi:hypothetical protein
MSTPQWRAARPNSPYGSEPGARPPGRDSRVPGHPPTRGADSWDDAPTRRLPPQSGLTQPGRVPQDGRLRRTGRQPGGAPGPRGPQRAPQGGGSGGLRLGGSLSGGLGVAIVAASTALGASATMLTGKEPGTILGVFVIIGTLAAAVAVRPQAAWLILPVPVLSYFVAAMVTGVIYDHSADLSKTALAVNAAQWIANGFFAMLLATILAVVLVTARWLLWRRTRPVATAPGWPARPPANLDRTQTMLDDYRTQPVLDDYRTQPVLDDYWSPADYPNPYGPPGRGEQGRGEPIPPPTAPGGPGPWPGGPGGQRPGQPRPPRPDPRQPRPPGPDPYNFSSGA